MTSSMALAAEAGLDFGATFVTSTPLASSVATFFRSVGVDPQAAVAASRGGTIDAFLDWLGKHATREAASTIPWFAAGLYVFGVVPLLANNNPASRDAMLGYRRHLQDAGSTLAQVDTIDQLLRALSTPHGNEKGTRFHQLREQLMEIAAIAQDRATHAGAMSTISLHAPPNPSTEQPPRVRKGRIVSFLENERDERGTLWVVLGVVAGLVLAALALF